MTTVQVIFQDIRKLTTEALIVGFHEDVRPLKGVAGELDWLLCGSLSSLILTKKLTGALGDVALLTSRGKVPVQKIFLVGLGPRAGSTRATLQSAARIAATSAVEAGVRTAAIEYFPSSDMPQDTVVTALYQGLNEGASGRNFDVHLLAVDAAACAGISRLLADKRKQELL